MSGLNKAMIIGRLGKDPETRYLPSGSAVTNISVATSQTWKDKQTGEKQESTEWHNVVFFGRRAEVVGEYTQKGSLVYVSGALRTRKWKDKNGVDRYTTEIVGDEIQFLSSPNSSGGSSSHSQSQQSQQSQQASDPVDDFDDDIPF